MEELSFNKFPKSILQYIFSFLQVKDLMKCALLNQTFLNLIDNSSIIWKKKLLELGHENENQLEDLEKFYSGFEKTKREEYSNYFLLHYKHKLFSKGARDFWKSLFKGEKEIKKGVEWRKFSQKLRLEFENFDLFENCYKYLFLKTDDPYNEKNEIVQVKNFSLALSYFGQIEDSSNWSKNIDSLFKTGYFYGRISLKEIQECLRIRPHHYLLRFSSEFGKFVFSFEANGKVRHSRIDHKFGSNLYFFEDKQFNFLYNLLEYIANNTNLEPLYGSKLKHFLETVSFCD